MVTIPKNNIKFVKVFIQPGTSIEVITTPPPRRELFLEAKPPEISYGVEDTNQHHIYLSAIYENSEGDRLHIFTPYGEPNTPISFKIFLPADCHLTFSFDD